MKKVEKKNLEKIKELESKVSELTAGWQRTQADFLNYKKQTNDDRANLILMANSDFIYELLPVLDHFQLAAKHMPADLVDNNWAQGIKQIEKQFENILLEQGLTRIETTGTEFDPNLHEAVEEVESEQKSGTIVEEVLSGYKFGEKVLRPAKVKVAE